MRQTARLLWLGLASWLLPGSLLAQGAAGTTPGEVVLQLDSTAGQASPGELRETLRELLARLGLVLVAPGEAHAGRVRARVHISLEPDQAHVEVLGSAPDARSFERDVPRAETDSLFGETIGHVVLGLVEPLASAPAPAAEPPPAPPEPAQQPSATRDVAPIVLSLGAGAGALRATTTSAAGWLFSTLTLASERRLRPHARLQVGGVPRVGLSAHGAEATLRLFTVRAHALLAPWQGRRAALLGGLGAGLNVLTMKGGSSEPGVQYARDTLRVQPIAGALLAMQVYLHETVALVLGCGLDLDLQPRSWHVRSGADDQRFVETPYLVPYGSIALDVRVARTRRYESAR